MIFKDEVLISISSGKGGNGSASFRREKFAPDGGPDGGDGGDGGDVIFKVNDQLHTLANYHIGQRFKADNGEDGMGGQRFGKKGKDIVLEVPPGTIVIEVLDDDTAIPLIDLSDVNMSFVAVKGGHGGNGNVHYKTSIKQSPQYAQNGRIAQNKQIRLELKLIAHIGLAGFPNAGKSSLVSRLTNARPKVAHYPFTTLIPNLGMMIPEKFGDGLLIADIPGLIQGASKGKGLGIEFLKHIERTKLLLFIIDITDNPIKKFEILQQELATYSQKLSQRHYAICFNKIDLMPEIPDEIEKFSKKLKNQNIKSFFCSAGTGEGLNTLKKELFNIWTNIPNDCEEEIVIIPNDEKEFIDFTKGLDL